MPAAIWRDDFNRADGAVGSALTGQSYSVTGSFAISASVLNSIDPGNGNPPFRCVGNIGQADYVFGITIYNPVEQDPGAEIYFRYVDDNNYILIQQDEQTLQVYKVVGGTFTNLASISSGGDNGSRYLFYLTGSQLSVYIDGVHSADCTATDAILQSSTIYQIIRAHDLNGSNTPIAFDNLVIYPPISRPVNWIVAPNGSPAGDGTLVNPMDWLTSMTAKSLIIGDDHIQARTGSYGLTLAGTFTPTISGSASHSIIVERYPPDVDVPNRFPHIHYQTNFNNVEAQYVDFTDIDFGGNDPTRYTGYHGVGTGSVTVCVELHAPGVRLLNCCAHDMAASAIDLWESSSGAEIYMNCMYNTGWKDITNGLPAGHGTYTQHDSGDPLNHKIRNNIVWNTWNFGLQGFGSSNAQIQNYDVTGNTYFYCGVPGFSFADGQGSQDMLLGGLGSTVIKNMNVDSNITWGVASSGISLGYTGQHNANCSSSNNYIVQLLTTPLNFQYFDAIASVGNTVVQLSLGGLLVNPVWLAAKGPPSGTVDNNTYYSVPSSAYFVENTDSGNFSYPTMAAWTAARGYDVHSSFTYGAPRGQHIMVKANTERPNIANIPRAHITVIDWDGGTEATADVSSCLNPGDTWALWHVFNWVPEYDGATGTPLDPKPADQTGIYNGKPITIKLKAVAPPQVVANGIGQATYDPLRTPPAGQPGVYVLVQTGNIGTITNKQNSPSTKRWFRQLVA